MNDMTQPDQLRSWMANGDPVTLAVLIGVAMIALWLLFKLLFGVVLRLLLVAVAAGIIWAALVSTGRHHAVMDRLRDLIAMV